MHLPGSASENPSTGDVGFRAAEAAQALRQLRIRNMGAIYSGAVFTIANAAASSADNPMPGFRSDAPRRVPLTSVQTGENPIVAATTPNA